MQIAKHAFGLGVRRGCIRPLAETAGPGSTEKVSTFDLGDCKQKSNLTVVWFLLQEGLQLTFREVKERGTGIEGTGEIADLVIQITQQFQTQSAKS